MKYIEEITKKNQPEKRGTAVPGSASTGGLLGVSMPFVSMRVLDFVPLTCTW
jgi:hypothetical protein